MKIYKGIIILGVVIACFGFFNIQNDYVFALEETEDVEKLFEDSVNETLQNTDLSQFDSIISNLDEESVNSFGTSSFFDKVNQILSGEMGENFGTILLQILNLLFGNIGRYLPVVCVVVAIAILGSLVAGLKSDGAHNVDQIVGFACFGFIVVLISVQCVDLLNQVQNCINQLKLQMDAIFPILLTFVAGLGGAVSLGIFQTSTAILANLVLQVFTIFIIPLFLISFVFSILGNLVDSVKLSKFNDLIGTILKWSIGIVFGVFSTVLTIQGVVAGSFDGMSINATKFALKSYIPILGGYLSDGFNYVAASGVVVKNSVGLAGLMLLVSSILPCFVRLVVFAVLLKLASAVCEPIGMNRISNFLSQSSKLLFYLTGILLSISFMYVLTLGLIMSITNLH